MRITAMNYFRDMKSKSETAQDTVERRTFESLGIREELLRAITELGFEEPTPIQELVLSKFSQVQNDLIALAQTGTGKTAAFGLSVCSALDDNQRELQVLVLTPTRELCNQVATELTAYTKYLGLRITPVYGGASMERQIKDIRRNPHMLVATPGRLVDLINRGVIDLSKIRYVVLDEADEMLNMGFKEDLNTILEQTPAERRTLLFSATMPNEVASIARKYMKDSIELTAGIRNAGADTVEHEYYVVHAKDKYSVLRRIIDVNPGMYGIVFCRTRQETQEVASKLMRDGYNAEALHGDMNQSARDYAMEKFRIRHLQILVATDVAARGIDVSNLTHVVNFSLPESSEVYNHRSGRTGRAGSTGVSATIVNMHERGKIKMIERYIKREFSQKQIPTGEQIMKARLAAHIDTVLNYEVDESRATEVIAIVKSKLGGVDKEELVTRFVMMEFTRLFKDYENAPDLNVNFKHEPRGSYNDRMDGGRRTNGRFNDRFNDGGGDGRRNRFERTDSRFGAKEGRSSEGRNEGRGSKPGFERSSTRMVSKNGPTTRLVLNNGARNKMNPGKLLGMLNDAVGHNRINVDNISIETSSTYFTVSKNDAPEIIEGFERRFGANNMRVIEI